MHKLSKRRPSFNTVLAAKKASQPHCARLGRLDGLSRGGVPDEPLYLRDLTNKLVHSSHYTWNLKDEMEPKLICHSPDPERWKFAEVDMVRLAALCGQLMS